MTEYLITSWGHVMPDQLHYFCVHCKQIHHINEECEECERRRRWEQVRVRQKVEPAA